ncbi:hypothetical protein IAQ61_000402 [Plenodomus lingam]|uniref:uncharacterized protein n=1 Tax=Leptosphaeria maculans TaxID=5022 RepID=UPI0033218A99|nr:hypothetical protein IAQ61_000402 [Plenodomus lingam]
MPLQRCCQQVSYRAKVSTRTTVTSGSSEMESSVRVLDQQVRKQAWSARSPGWGHTSYTNPTSCVQINHANVSTKPGGPG